LHIYISGTNIW